MEMFIIAAVCGIVVGLLSGLLGIGGGTIMVPLFRLAFGLSPIMATATSLFTIIPTSLAGMAKHVRNKTSLPRVGLICGIAGACTSPLGVAAADVSPGWAIMAAAAAVIVYSSYTMFKKALAAPKIERRRKVKDGEASAPAPAAAAGAAPEEACASAGAAAAGSTAASAPAPAAPAPEPVPNIAITPSFVVKAVLIGLAAGFVSGYVGVGGGFLMVPMFVALLGVPMRMASGTSLLAVCILAVPGTIEQGLLGNIDYAIGIAMAVGSIPGAIWGANLAKSMPERTLRFTFAIFLLVVAVILAVTEFSSVL